MLHIKCRIITTNYYLVVMPQYLWIVIILNYNIIFIHTYILHFIKTNINKHILKIFLLNFSILSKIFYMVSSISTL